MVKSLHRYYEAYVFDLSFSGVKEKTLLAQYFHGESGEELVNCIVFVKKEKWYNDNQATRFYVLKFINLGSLKM